MITVVVDTNTLASGLVRRQPPTAVVQVVDGWRARKFRLAVSEHVIAELARTLAIPYFQQRITSQRAQRFISLLRRRATIVPITAQVSGVATHPEDDLVLATAVSVKADYLVSGDHKLQDLGSYQGVTIVSARGFVPILARLSIDV
jgi:putative PIN family toxin of toxin-antitoxin system